MGSDTGIAVKSVNPKTLIQDEKKKLFNQLKEKKAQSSSNNEKVELPSSISKPGTGTMTASDYKKVGVLGHI